MIFKEVSCKKNATGEFFCSTEHDSTPVLNHASVDMLVFCSAFSVVMDRKLKTLFGSCVPHVYSNDLMTFKLELLGSNEHGSLSLSLSYTRVMNY